VRSRSGHGGVHHKWLERVVRAETLHPPPLRRAPLGGGPRAATRRHRLVNDHFRQPVLIENRTAKLRCASRGAMRPPLQAMAIAENSVGLQILKQIFYLREKTELFSPCCLHQFDSCARKLGMIAGSLVHLRLKIRGDL
jgi:hypothetical protein